MRSSSMSRRATWPAPRAARLRVASGDADESLLIQKLEGHQSCGNPMPPSGSSILQQDPTLIAEIRSWIDAGARND